MSKHTVSIISIFLLVLLSATLLAACGSNSPTSAPATSAPSSGGPTNAPATSAPTSGGSSNGQTLMQERCSVCHSTNRITSAHKTADAWKTTVDRMISHGAQLSSQEEQTLVDYLAQNYK